LVSDLRNISPEILREQHRLSLRQVNSLFGAAVFPEIIEERISEFETVKEYLTVYDGLLAAKIAFIPLKGPVLSYRLYGDATMRNYNDIDLLIDVNNIDRTKTYFEKLGYRIGYIVWPDTKDLQQRLIRHINHITMTNPEKGLVVEIHWRLFRTPAISFSEYHDLVKRNLTTLTFADRSFTVLNNELEFLYLIIHGGLHFWMRLKWLLDLDIYLKTIKIDWDRFQELTKDLRANRMVALFKVIYKKYFPEAIRIQLNSPVPQSIISYSGKRISDERKTDMGSLKWVLMNFFFTLIAFPGARYKIRETGNFLFMSIYSGRLRIMLPILERLNRFEKRADNP
jgi:hypothetical protein